MGDIFSLRGIAVLLIAIYFGVYSFKRPIFGASLFMVILLLKDAYLRVVFPAAYEQLHLPMVFGLLTLFSIIFKLKEHSKFIGIPLEIKLLGAYVCSIYVSVFINGYNPALNDSPYEAFTFVLLFMIIMYSIKNIDDLYLIIKVIAYSSIFIFINAYYDYRVNGFDLSDDRYYYMNRNTLGAMFCSSIPLVLILTQLNKKIIAKCAFYCAGCALALGTILTYSRGAFVGMIVSILIMVVFNRKSRSVLIMLLIFGSIAVSLRVSSRDWNRIDTIENYEEDASAMGRIATNKAAINMIKSHPLFGVGAGTFPDKSLEYTPEEMKVWVPEGKQIHNIFLQAFSETGIIGGSFFVTMILVVVIRGYRRIRDLKHNYLIDLSVVHGLLASLVGYIVTAQFGQGAYFGPIFYLIPILVSACIYAKEPESSGSPEVRV